MTPIERRAFELFGERDMSDRALLATVAQEFGISKSEAREIAKRVLRLYGTPALAAAREAIDRLEKVRF